MATAKPFKKKIISAHSNLMDQYMHTLIYLHINILYGNSYTFKKKFIPAHSNLMDQYIHSFTLSFISTFTFCVATASLSKNFIHTHSNLMDQYIHTHLSPRSHFVWQQLHIQKIHTDRFTFKFDGPRHSNSFISTFTFCLATASHSQFSYQHIQIQI